MNCFAILYFFLPEPGIGLNKSEGVAVWGFGIGNVSYKEARTALLNNFNNSGNNAAVKLETYTISIIIANVPGQQGPHMWAKQGAWPDSKCSITRCSVHIR